MYDLCNLGWNSFQQLCLTIVREILGQTVESFLDSGDGGRDGAFTGMWNAAGQEALRGPFVIQCKFTSKANYVLKASDISDEVEKARKLVERGLCESYVLLTNAGLTGTGAGKIEGVLKAVGVEHVVTFGSSWINQQILENVRLRTLVPRVYGLGDLSQILDARAYSQARSILESMREDLAKVIVTNAYRRAVDAIEKHGFVLLIGEPAAGKTTIASLLAMMSLDLYNASILKLDDPRKVTEHWNPDEPSQFFWLDDAFGVTQYEDSLVLRWNRILPHMRALIGKGAKIVMTSRDYIYNRARNDLKESAFPLLNESQVVIDVRDLSADEKRQILYNHVKLGRQPRSFRSKIKPYLDDVAIHQRFIPEIARRFADPLFTKDLVINEYHIKQFVEKREQLLQEILQSLDTDSKAALALIYMRNGYLESPIELDSAETQALGRLGSTPGGCIAALEALNGSLVLLSHASGQAVWQFKHPTVGDAYAAILIQSPEHIGIFIQGSEPERLVGQVTCGEFGIENAVVVPKSLFPQMLAKLEPLRQRRASNLPWLITYGVSRRLQGFLARRCSKEFLSLYLQQDSDLLDQICEPGLYLDTAPEVRLAQRLHEFGLLPDEQRTKFVETVSDYALQGLDAGALNDDEIQSLFTGDEFEQLVQRIRVELIPRLQDVRYDHQFDCLSTQPPEEHMQPFLDFLNSLKAQFGDDESAVELIDCELWRSREWIEENTPQELGRPPRQLAKVDPPEKPQSARSIFDDIDADGDSERV